MTFSPFEFQQKDFGEKTIAELRQEFAAGAVAVKIWKNIGMEFKTTRWHVRDAGRSGFEPIYKAMPRKIKRWWRM